MGQCAINLSNLATDEEQSKVTVRDIGTIILLRSHGICGLALMLKREKVRRRATQSG
jgi:hypothetical protein